jgi:integrase
MALVTRKRARGVTYYVVHRWQGRICWENAGTVRRQAEELDRQRKREKKLGTFRPVSRTDGGRLTMRGYVDAVQELRERKVRNATDEMSWVRNHVLNRKWLADTPMAEVRPRFFDRLVAELRANTIDGKPVEGRKPLSDKSINNVLHACRTMFRTAVREDLLDNQPVTLEPRTLRLQAEKERETYEPGEVHQVLTCVGLPEHERVFCALSFYTGMRLGEVCGRRIRDILDAPILPALDISTQYDDQPLKTDSPRLIPMHPELREILTTWLEGGFALYTTRAPEPEDFIVPNAGPWARRTSHTKKSGNMMMQRAFALAGVRYRTVHSTRHTFISMARRAGVDSFRVDLLTHNRKRTQIDRYTHTDWEPLCAAVSLVRFDVHQTQHFPQRTSKQTRVVSGLDALRKSTKGRGT